MSKGTLDDQVELTLSRFDNEEDDLQVFGERRDSEEEDTIRKYDDDESDKPFMSKYKKLWYATIIARFPILSLIFFAAIPIVLTGIAATYPVQIDYSLTSFRARGHEVIIQIEAFRAATSDYYQFLITWWDRLQQFTARSSSGPVDSIPNHFGNIAHPGWNREMFSNIDNINFSIPLEQKYTTVDGLSFGVTITKDFQQGSEPLRTKQSRESNWSVHLVFFASKKGGNIITPEDIEKMNNLKKQVEAMEGYTDFCTTTYYKGVLQCEEPQSLLPFFFPSHDPTTGVGIPDGKGDKQADLVEALTAVFRQGIYHFTDERFKPSTPVSEYFRIQFRFGRPVKGFSYSNEREEEQWEKYRTFINSKLSFFKSLDSKELPVMFGGNSLTDHEILKTVWGDATLAIASLSVVFILMYVSMGSFFPSFMGMLMICFSFPTVYFIFRVILAVDHVGILNVLALFVIIGVGVDDLFVFFNTFQHYENINDVELRLAETIRHAAKATFITSFTTAASFGINAVSTIPALRFFGIFMGMLVMLNYFMAISWYPAVLVIWEKYWKKRLERFDPMQRLWNRFSSRVAYKPMKFTDTQLTSFETSSEESDSDESQQGYNYAERFFRTKFAPMIEKRRVIIIVVFAVVIGASIFSITKLGTSDHVPTLFPASSNLQRFLNWELNGLFYSTGAAISLDPNLKYGCDGVLNSGATKDVCGVCNGNCDTCRDCTGQFPRSCGAFQLRDSCGVCGGNGTSCVSCDGRPGSNKRFDACGVCGGTNSTCAGCDWIPYSNKTRDACGVCGGDGSSCAGCDGLPNSNKTLDVCGVCGGDSTSCAGCDGIPNSGKKYDVCGVCGGDGSSCVNPPVNPPVATPPVKPPTPVSPPVGNTPVPDSPPVAPRPPVTTPVAAPISGCRQGFDPCGVCGGNGSTCAGCDGIPYSGKVVDPCGVCGGNGSTCAGCDGVPNSGKVIDKCGVCGGDNSCLGCDGVFRSNKSLDLCGVCDGNNACLGCDGKPNSGKTLDVCGVCGGDGKSCFGCDGVLLSNKTIDGCDVCAGDNTTCGGCDHIPYSTTKFDQCGVCGGNNECYKNQVNFEEIDIVFGIKGLDATGFDPNNIFQEKSGNVIYDPNFEVSDPEVQRALLSACLLISNSSELVQPGKTRCYMQQFKEWLLQKRHAFPILNKNNFFLFSAQFIGAMSRSDQNWLWDVGFDLVNNKTDQMTIKWVRYHFQTTIVKGRTSFENYNDFLKWNELVEKVNQLSPKAQAFHTTHAWDVMITEVVAVSGIKWGLIVSAIVALGSILVFTGNIVVSILAIVSVLGNIAVMLGCFWIFGWSLGVVEALSITILVGLSVDYCIHIAETYNSKWSESRSNKLRHALTSMGFSVLSGALTTMGAVFILLFCTVQIFVTFGVIIAVNSFLSVVFTLFFFSSLLSAVGPVRHQGSFYALLCCLVCKKRRKETSVIESMEEL
jgi:predicted RND superfamily exporter protein